MIMISFFFIELCTSAALLWCWILFRCFIYICIFKSLFSSCRSQILGNVIWLRPTIPFWNYMLFIFHLVLCVWFLSALFEHCMCSEHVQ